MKPLPKFRNPVHIIVTGKCTACNRLMVTKYHKGFSEVRCERCGEARFFFTSSTSVPTAWGGKQAQQ